MNRTALFFDIDNTLLNRDRAFRKFITEFVHNEKGFAGLNRTGVIEDIIAMDERGLKDRELFCREVLRTWPLELTVEELWERHRSLPDFITPDERVAAMLADLSREYTLAVLSNGSSFMQRRKLNNLGITKLFDHIFISGELKMAKPDSRFFRTAVERVGGERFVMIGDDEEKDIVPASQLSFKTVLISDHTNVSTAADAVISEIYDFKEVVQWLI